MNDRRRALRVKIKSLAVEAKIIRQEEHKAKDHYERLDLADHRRGIVRTEARYAQLAYACLRGRPYHEVEQPRKGNEPCLKKLIDHVQRFSFMTKPEANALVWEWYTGSLRHVEATDRKEAKAA